MLSIQIYDVNMFFNVLTLKHSKEVCFLKIFGFSTILSYFTSENNSFIFKLYNLNGLSIKKVFQFVFFTHCLKDFLYTSIQFYYLCFVSNKKAAQETTSKNCFYATYFVAFVVTFI